MRRGTQLLSRSLSAAIMTRAASRYRRTTSSAPVGLAPDPRVTPEAVARAVPELGLDLPPTAIGKDYLGDRLLATAPSGGGFQLSLLGLLGVLASGVEGFEVNLLGLTFGIDPFSPALRLPLVGRFGAARSNGAGTPASITAGRS